MVSLKQIRRFILSALLGVWLVIIAEISEGYPFLYAATNNSQPSSLVPTLDWQGTKLPDWSKITFASLPAISQNGYFRATPEVVSQLDYDPSRSWMTGQTPDTFLKLGDFQESFKLQNFDLSNIAQLVGLDLKDVTLDKFGAIAFQNLESLVQAVSGLGERLIQDTPPVMDLLKSKLVTDFDPSQTINQLLQQSPLLGKLDFSSLDLSKYGLDSLPGIDITPIGAFKDWQAINVNSIPGLKDVPFSEFPNPINAVGSTVGTVDIAFGSAEQQRKNAISGSDVEGFNVRCESECAHIELAGSPTVLGKQWISGKSQEVRGGHGVLASANGGKEPTGRHPFGNAFKVAIWDVSEPEGTATLTLFFRICIDFLGCTPYFIGPVPFMTVKEMQPIFLGLIEPGASSGVSTPTGVPNGGTKSTFNNTPLIGKPESNSLSHLFPSTKKGDCSARKQGVVLDALSLAVSEIEGNYNSVGAYLCDGKGNCGRGLGAKQFMSYRSDLRSIISSKPDGENFIAKLDSGVPISGEELLLYFSPADQEALFRSDASALIDRASRQTDPTTGQLFSGDSPKETLRDRLIERVAQMHFGGSAIPIDSAASDINNRFTVKTYGEKAAANYQQALQTMGCS